MPNSELCTTERVAIVAYRLAIGEQLTTSDVANLIGISHCGAWEMLNKLSRVLPIAQDRTPDGRPTWFLIE